MADNKQISVAFKFVDKDGGIKVISASVESLQKVISATVEEAEKLKKPFINFAALATGINAVSETINNLQNTLKDLSDVYAKQIEAETKLAVNMRNSMNAREEDIQSIKDLCSAQQKLGVIGDEVQLAGAQEMATYLGEKESLEKLIPVMNDMIAQQYGLNATQDSAVNIATMLGKVMEGQVGALSRYGYSFDEVQEKILKYGTEAERAAVLAEVVESAVGGMNAELAKTDIGKTKQIENRIGDITEMAGATIQSLIPYTAIAANLLTVLGAAIKLKDGLNVLYQSTTLLVGGIKDLIFKLCKSTEAFVISTAGYIKNKAAMLAMAAAQKTVAAATAAWSAAQKVLNLILKANPIGLIITAIGALVGAIVYAYNNCESFREIVNKVWSAIKPLASAIMDGLVIAFEWLVEKSKEAWEWLKNILGLGGKKVEVAVDVSETKSVSSVDLDETRKKYADYTETAKNANTVVKSKQEDIAPEGSIKDLQKQLSGKKAEFDLATSDQSRRNIAQEIAEVESQIQRMQDNASRKSVGAVDIKTVLPSTDAIVDSIEIPDMPELDLTSSIDGMQEKAREVVQHYDDIAASMQRVAETQGKLGAISSIMSDMSGVVGESAGAWLSYMGNVVGAVQQALPAISSLIAALTAKAAGEAMAENAAMGPFGWISGVAAIAGVIAAMATLPKFADGGIAYGPTVGLFGEYAGASNNPEVVAPLDKLRSLIEPRGEMAGRVEFEIDGRRLKGVLNKVDHLSNRS